MNRWRDRVDNDLAYLKGSDRERYCRDKAHALFSQIARSGHNPAAEVIERLWDALQAGKVARIELNHLADADVLWMGEYEVVPVLFVCEVSFHVDRDDIQRAVERAEIARKLGYIAVPVVAGVLIPNEVEEYAYSLGAIVITDSKFNHERTERVLKQAIEQAKGEQTE